MRPAWAITIHKSQGMTLETAELDLARCFDEGHAYVALSRAVSLRQARLASFDPTRVRANKRVAAFYDALEAEQQQQQQGGAAAGGGAAARMGGGVQPLRERAHAGVGAPGADQGHRMVGHPGQALLHLFLNGAHAGLLGLPAMKGASACAGDAYTTAYLAERSAVW